MKSIDPENISIGEKHRNLLTSIAPRPIALASTINNDGIINLSPFSFFNVFSSNPPTLIFSPARRGRDNTTKDTYENVKQIPEVVINVVDYSMVEQTSLASCEFPSSINEFEKAGFNTVLSEKIRPPRVRESPASFECVVEKVIELGQIGGAGNLIIARVVMMHFSNDILNIDGNVDATKLKLVGRMGGNLYVKAFGNALFEVAKPTGIGVGIDQLPKEIRESTILTGNELAKLGSLHTLPTREVILATLESEQLKNTINLSKNDADPNVLQRLAKNYLGKNQALEAYALLMLPIIH